MKPTWVSDCGTVELYCADCRDVLPTLGPVDCVVTDPPYGVDLGNHEGAKETRPGLLIRQGGYADSPELFDEVVVPVVKTCIGISNRAMVFGVPPSIWKLPPPVAIGGVFIAGACGRNKWGWSNLIHCLLYGIAPDLNLGAKPTAIASSAIADKVDHPTPKPTRWMKWAVGLGSKETETVLDPFMGSGTTGVACVQLGRRFIGIEIDPGYFEIAKKRISDALLQIRMPI